MPKKGYTEEQIIGALKQYETWKKQYAGMGVQELRELRQLRDENSRLKRLVADPSLDRQILQ